MDSTAPDPSARRVPGGPPAAGFTDAWGRLRLPMLQLATMLVDRHDIAEEVVQDAFLNLHRRWDSVADPAAYLRVSVVNGSRSVLRRRRLARLHLASALDAPAPGADCEVLIADEHRQVLRALHRLPRRQREVLVLKYWNDLDDDTIAASLTISASTVRATATRARHQLARILEEGA